MGQEILRQVAMGSRDVREQGFVPCCQMHTQSPFLSGPKLCTYNDTIYGVRAQSRHGGWQG